MADPTLPHDHARTTVRALVITPQGGEPFLILEIEILCPLCGDCTIQIGGHHTATLAESLQQVRQDYPAALTTLEVTDQQTTSWSGTVDPSKSHLN